MHGRATTVPCLRMDRLDQESHTLSWATGPTRALFLSSVTKSSRLLR